MVAELEDPGKTMSDARSNFMALLSEASQSLFETNRDRMISGSLIPTPNVIDEGDCKLFFAAIDSGLVEVEKDGRFNTLDRPTPEGRWALLSRSKIGGWYDAEYLPQIAAYAELVLRRGFHRERVLFELPTRSLQLDLAVLDDHGKVVVLGEAKKDAHSLTRLAGDVVRRFSAVAPGPETKKRGDESRQLAWRLWAVRPPYLWLVGPGLRLAFRCSYEPLYLEELRDLPTPMDLSLTRRPPRMMAPPMLLSIEN